MRRGPLAFAAMLLFALPLAAQTADEIVSKYVKTIGGMDKLEAIKSLRRSGKFTGGGGFEARVVQENRRPNMIRQEFIIQGMTGVTAYDGKNGWKIEPWQGKKDAESLGEDELKDIVAEAEFDGPLVNAAAKGNRIEYVGTEQVEGTDTYKLKVTLASGEVRYYYMDTDYYVPIKVETKRVFRGAEREFESTFGDYKEVNGVYFPFSQESGVKGSQGRAKVTIEKIDANTQLADNRFTRPGAGGKSPEERQGQPADASQDQPKNEKTTKQSDEKKPPVTR
jgi:hypothetical protein